MATLEFDWGCRGCGRTVPADAIEQCKLDEAAMFILACPGCLEQPAPEFAPILNEAERGKGEVRRLVFQTEMLTDPYNGIYTQTNYYSDESVEVVLVPKGKIILKDAL